MQEVLGQRVPRRPAWSSFGAASARCSRAGKAGGRSPIARSRASPTTGAPPATSRPWCSATWATPRPRAWPSRATRPPARTSSTASGWSTPRARTWWPASARRNPLNEATKNRAEQAPALAADGDGRRLYKQLDAIRIKLEKHYHDMLDIEFTIQEGKLYMLQCRDGKRTGTAALNMAMDMLARGADRREDGRHARQPTQLDELLHPMVDPDGREEARRSSRACRPAPAARAARWSSPPTRPWPRPRRGEKVILVREETNPEDVEGMRAAEGILTARGGMTSHAALVARGWGKCCIVGAGDLRSTWARKRHQGRRREAQGRRLDHAERHHGHGLRRAPLEMIGRHGEPALPEVHEAGGQVPQAGRAHQRRHAARREGGPRSSAPRASACSAPSTCSTAKAPTSRCSCCAR